jgi:hypothetical protein
MTVKPYVYWFRDTDGCHSNEGNTMKMIQLNRKILISPLVMFFAVLAINSVGVAQEQVSRTGRTFAWVSQNVHFYDAARFPDWNVKEKLEDAIIAGFEKKGLNFTESLEAADFELSYIAVLENASTPTEIASFREAHPEIAALPNDPEKFEGGMLFAKLVNRHTRVKMWDNTYRGIVALDMPEAPRAKRVDEIVTELLSTYNP